MLVFFSFLFHFFAKKSRMKHTKDNEMPGTE